MKLYIFIIFNILLISCSRAQDEDIRQALSEVFTSPKSFLDGYEEVTKKADNGFGALTKCGEGDDKGVHACVPYHNCDGITKMIITTGSTDGFGIIDIRFGANSCAHFLDVCCGIPNGGIPPEVTTPVPPIPTRPTTPSTNGGGSDDGNAKKHFCGIRNINGLDFKITGNKDNEAEYGEFPWMVEIIKKGQNGHAAVCGGSLVAPNVVLTAAHCVNTLRADEIKVRAGEWDTQTLKERIPYQELDVTQIIVHKDFKPGPVYNDVALLLLTASFVEAENIGTICLPDQLQELNSRNCFAMGWGKDRFDSTGQFQVILKKIELPLMTHPKCENALRTTRLGQFFNLHTSFICAGGEEGKDTCTGDGGSPLVCPDPANPNRYLQAGIVAWGIGCGEHGIPGVYAKVSTFRDWIDEQFQRLAIDSTPYRV